MRYQLGDYVLVTKRAWTYLDDAYTNRFANVLEHSDGGLLVIFSDGKESYVLEEHVIPGRIAEAAKASTVTVSKISLASLRALDSLGKTVIVRE
jgi:hypothetical protein